MVFADSVNSELPELARWRVSVGVSWALSTRRASHDRAPATERRPAELRPGDPHRRPPQLRGSSKMEVAQRLFPVLVGPPAEDLAVAELEGPGHEVDAGDAFVFLPVPAPQDQRHRPAAASLGPVLIEVLQLDRLLNAPRRPRRPHPRCLDSLPQPPARVQLDLRVEDGDKRIQVALVEGADELADRVSHAPLGAVALLELFP